MNKIDTQKELVEIMKKIFQDNIEEEYLIDNNFQNKDTVMVLGINPGDEPDDNTKNKKQSKENKPLNKLLCFDKNYLKTLQSEKNISKKQTENLLEQIDGNYRKYHFPNYNLFSGLNGKMFWADENCSLTDELKEKIKDDELKNVYNEVIQYEKDKKGPLVIFGDLFWCTNSNQKEIEAILKKYKKEQQDLNELIQKIIKNHINYYKPKMIVVTNAYASKLLLKALFNKDDKDDKDDEYDRKDVSKCEYENVTFIFSGMVSGQRALDKYSYIRLKEQVTEEYEKKKSK